MSARHIRRFLRLAWRIAALPIAGLAAGLATAALVTALITPTYTASASVIVLPEPNPVTLRVDLADVSLAQTLVSSVARLAESGDVAHTVATKVGLSDDEVTGHLIGVPRPGTEIVTVEATADSSATAAAMADAAIIAVADRATELKLGGSTVSVKPLDTATRPGTPTTPRPALNYALGALAGLLFGIGAITLRTRFSERFQHIGDVEAEIGLPVFAVIKGSTERLRESSARELYDTAAVGSAVDGLVAALSVLLARRDGRRIMITGVRDDDGGALVAALLAIGLRNPMHGTTLLEGMPNQPEVHRYFPGYAEGAAEEAAEQAAEQDLLSSIERLERPRRVAPMVLSLGDEGDHLGREPQFEKVGLLVDKLVWNGDDVVVRAPSVLSGRGMAELAPHADVVLLVVDSDRARRTDARLAGLLVQHLGVPLAGVVVTGSAAADDGWLSTTATSAADTVQAQKGAR